MEDKILELCKRVEKSENNNWKCYHEFHCDECPFGSKKNNGKCCGKDTHENYIQIARNYIKEHENTVNTINSIEEQTITLDDLKDIKENNIVPKYYHRGAVDTIQFCLENNLNFLQGNIIKYVVRYKEKNGLEDLKKAQEYLRRLIENEEKKESDINE